MGLAILAALLTATSGASAYDLILIGADTGASASATATCEVGSSSAHAKGVGTSSASASASAHVSPGELKSTGTGRASGGVATFDAAASGVGLGYASASASGSGQDGSSAHASFSCDLRPIISWSSPVDIVIGPSLPSTDPITRLFDQNAALALPYGCAASAGDASAAIEGILGVDAATGAVWLVGSVTREGVSAPFATPVGEGLTLTADLAGGAAPALFQETPLRLHAAFDAADGQSACVASLTG